MVDYETKALNAIKVGDLNELKTLHEEAEDMELYTDILIRAAVQNGQTEILEYLIDLDQMDNLDVTALLLECQYYHEGLNPHEESKKLVSDLTAQFKYDDRTLYPSINGVPLQDYEKLGLTARQAFSFYLLQETKS